VRAKPWRADFRISETYRRLSNRIRRRPCFRRLSPRQRLLWFLPLQSPHRRRWHRQPLLQRVAERTRGEK
jgi:hypothetical protein